MKTVFKKVANKTRKRIYTKVENEFLKLNQRNVDSQLGRWINFYYPIGGGCFYVLGGKIVKRRKQKESLNKSISVQTRLSKEPTELTMPVQVRHFLITN